MRELEKWQIVSFVSRGLAMVFGLLQSFIIIRILTLGEWGIVQLASSIGASLGIYQHLGLASASTREIASAKNDTSIFKIFITSVVIRYLVTFPLALSLIFFGHKIAVGLYHNELLILPLKIYGFTLLFQGFQSILNSVISGTKRFKRLFIYQVFISFLGILLYVPLVYIYKINGFFYAYFTFNFLNTLLLFYLAFKPLKGSFTFPTLADFKLMFREIFSISIAIYVVKIIATNWEKLGTNVLGLKSTPEVIAIFAFALLYARKILSISDAVTDVNLPIYSEKFMQDIGEFKQSFKQNFNKVYAFIIITAAAACYWAPELISFLVNNTKYSASYRYIPAILFAFIIYAVLDIVKSSVLVPAKLTKTMIVTYLILISTTAAAYFGINKFTESLLAMSLAFGIGSSLTMVYVKNVLVKKLNISVFDLSHWLLLLQYLAVGLFGIYTNAGLKYIVFPLFFMLQLYAIFLSGHLNWDELKNSYLQIWKKIN